MPRLSFTGAWRAGLGLSISLSVLPAVAAAQGRGGPGGPGGPVARPPSIPKSGVVPREPNVEKKLQADFKAPDGFTVSLFAGPPIAMYPTCVAESPDGAIFACVDPNLSLSTLKGVGRVMRLVDTDHDGHADQYTTFAEMDSPRGIVADGKTVYVMHPPTLTAYRDTNGDGISDESVDIVTGLGFDLDFRGADHTTNNVELGPDGWLYVAVGDYGYIHAQGTDGRQIQHRGGSVVRVRPDGSNLEIVATGTRNIYDVAIDPFTRLYARDNTNDGDGWDTRLHYLAPGADMGYPTKYQNFEGEHFPSLFDYGGGSGVGSIWLQDPAWPEGFNNTLYTEDWTVQKVYRHVLKPKGAIFDIEQHDFISVLRPSDVILDGSSNMYVSSLAGGQFTYASDTVGYIVQVRAPTTSATVEAPVFSASDEQLLTQLASDNAVRRLHAQQELLRRGPKVGTVASLRRAIADNSKSAEARAMAIFTLKQLQGAKANDAILGMTTTTNARVREAALHALADRTDQLAGVTSTAFIRGLSDTDPQVRVQAIRGLVRVGARDAGDALVRLAGSKDQGTAHLAANAVASLGAQDAVARGLAGTPEVRAGALRSIKLMHTSASVTTLLAELAKPTQTAATRRGLVDALARLYNREGFWRGDWWTTKPYHLGPYFDAAPWEESPRIKTALSATLLATSGSELDTLVADLALNAAIPRGASALIAAVNATKDPLRADLIAALVGRQSIDEGTGAIVAQLDAKGGALHAAVAQLLAGESQLAPNLLSVAKKSVLDTQLDAKTRAALLTSLGSANGQAALATAVEVYASLNPAAPPPGAAPAGDPGMGGGRGGGRGGGPPGVGSSDPVEAAWRRFVGDRRRMEQLDYFIELATKAPTAQRVLAHAVLLQSVRTPRTPPPVREKVTPVIDAAWNDPTSAASLVQAIGIMRVESQYAEKLEAYKQKQP